MTLMRADPAAERREYIHIYTLHTNLCICAVSFLDADVVVDGDTFIGIENVCCHIYINTYSHIYIYIYCQKTSSHLLCHFYGAELAEPRTFSYSVI